jgi:hypothetical protein
MTAITIMPRTLGRTLRTLAPPLEFLRRWSGRFLERPIKLSPMSSAWLRGFESEQRKHEPGA